MGNARNLEFSSRRGDVRVQAGARGCHQVDWDRSSWILLLKFLYVALNALKQILVRGSQIRAATRRWIISGSCRRRPRVKITRSGERLSNDSRADELSIFLYELSVRTVMEKYLCQSGDSERINEAKH